MVNPIRDRLGEIIALPWRICPIKISNDVENTVIAQNLTPTLVKTLRYHIYNLAAGICDILLLEQLVFNILRRGS